MTTYFEFLTSKGLPIIEADETGSFRAQKMTDEQIQILQDAILEWFQPAKYTELQERRAVIQSLKDDYLTALSTLQQIQNTASPTNAQVIAAVKFEAKTLERLLKFLKAQFVG